MPVDGSVYAAAWFSHAVELLGKKVVLFTVKVFPGASHSICDGAIDPTIFVAPSQNQSMDIALDTNPFFGHKDRGIWVIPVLPRNRYPMFITLGESFAFGSIGHILVMNRNACRMLTRVGTFILRILMFLPGMISAVPA